MNLAKYLSVSLIALAAGSASAGEFYQNGPIRTSDPARDRAGVTDERQLSAGRHPKLRGTAGQFSGYYGTFRTGFLRCFCIEFQAAGGDATYNLDARRH